MLLLLRNTNTNAKGSRVVNNEACLEGIVKSELEGSARVYGWS